MRRLAAALGLLLTLAWPAQAVDLRLFARGTGGAAAATFVNAAARQIASSTDSFAFTTGGLAGDVLLAMCQNNTSAAMTSISVAHGAMTRAQALNITFNNTWMSVFWTVLQAGDLAPTPNVTLAGANTLGSCQTAIYRGPSTVTWKDSATANATATLVFSSPFTPAGGSKGVIIMASDRDAAAALTCAPQTCVSRLSSGGTFFSQSLLDVLTGWTNSATTVSGFVAASPQGGFILEFT